MLTLAQSDERMLSSEEAFALQQQQIGNDQKA
jgi:hypothetical protein